jgi:hypothetical protein
VTTNTLSVAQARIQLYPLIEQFEAGTASVVHIKSRSGTGAVLVSAEHYAELTK